MLFQHICSRRQVGRERQDPAERDQLSEGVNRAKVRGHGRTSRHETEVAACMQQRGHHAMHTATCAQHIAQQRVPRQPYIQNYAARRQAKAEGGGARLC